MGDRYGNLLRAEQLIEEAAGAIIRRSPVYETEPHGFVAPDWFLNKVILIETRLEASVLMKKLLTIEASMGRKRTENGFTSRIIDIDILFYGDHIINEGGLVIPHPGIALRRFVLEPVCAIDSRLVHPVLLKTAGELLRECSDTMGVRLYNNPLSAKL